MGKIQNHDPQGLAADECEKVKILVEIILIVGASALVGYELSNQLKMDS